MHRIALPIFFIFIFPLCTYAQESKGKTENQEFIWLRYYNKSGLGAHWQLHSEIEVRQFVAPLRLHQWVLPRIHLHYNMKNGLDIGAGGCYFLHALPQIADKDVDVLRQELRPHQEVSLNHSLGIFRLNHRYKIEERFFVKTLEDGADFIFRMRYKLQVQIPLNEIVKKIPFALVLYDEIMFNWGNGVKCGPFDQNRIFAALLFKTSDNWALELGYMNLFQQRPTPNSFYNRHILRMTLNHTLKKI